MRRSVFILEGLTRWEKGFTLGVSELEEIWLVK